jgi:hypothetical protein
MPSDTFSDPGSETSLEQSAETGRSRGVGVLSLLAAVGVGAAAMYFLDPDRGRRRRHLVRDKLVRAARVTGETAVARSRDVANRARGLGAAARRGLKHEDVDDVVLVERVRAELGRVSSHAGAIEVTAADGKVSLCGPVLANEADDIVAQVSAVRGVKSVDDCLERHEEAGSISSLQGSAQAALEGRT